jgi:hypothetical protein
MGRAPAPVWLAGVLVMAYGVVLLGEAVVLFAASAHGGTVAAPNLDSMGLRGLTTFALLLVVVAVLFEFAGVRFIRRGRSLPFVIPLAAIVLFGTIGEIADIAGGSDATGNLIGLGILVLAIVPIVLACLPSSRGWKGRSKMTESGVS